MIDSDHVSTRVHASSGSIAYISTKNVDDEKRKKKKNKHDGVLFSVSKFKISHTTIHCEKRARSTLRALSGLITSPTEIDCGLGAAF